MLTWQLRRMGQPSAFFTADGAPVTTPRVLTRDERAALDVN